MSLSGRGAVSRPRMGWCISLSAQRGGLAWWRGGGSWGLEMGPRARKTPLETMCGKYGAPGAGYFPLGFGSELVREAPHRQVARQGGSMAAVETPFS